MKIARKNKQIIKISIILIIIFFAIFSIIKLSDKYIKQGDSKAEQEHYENALLSYEKASVLNPLNSQINIKRAKIFEKFNKNDEAIKEYKKALSKNKNNEETRAYLINLLLKNNRIPETFEYIYFLDRKKINNSDLSLAISKIYFMAGNKDEAYAVLDKKDDAFILQKSIYKFLEEEYNDALELAKKSNINNNNPYKKAITTETNNNDFRKISVAQSLNEIGQTYFAKEIFEKMTEQGKEERDIYLYLGYSYVLEKNIQKAEENIEKAKKLDQVYGLTYYFLAKINILESKKEEAEKNLKFSEIFGYKKKNN